VLLNAFAHDVRIEHPLRLDLEDADDGIVELSDEQFRVLDISTASGASLSRVRPVRARRCSRPRRRAGSRPRASRCC
jgi:hypothetical protein